MKGYLIARKIKNNLYMPIVNPKQIRYVLNKTFYGETICYENIKDLQKLYSFIAEVDTENNYKILEIDLKSVDTNKKDDFITAYSFIVEKELVL